MHELLAKYTELIKTLNLSDEWQITDCKLRYLALSDGFLKFFAPQNPIGKRFRELTSIYNKEADYILSITQKLANSCQMSCRFLLLMLVNNQILYMETKIIKIIDAENGVILGFVFFYNHISQSLYIFNELYLKRHLNFIPILEKPNTYEYPEIYNQFSEREQIIIWLLAANNGHKQIANIISPIFKLSAPLAKVA